MGTHIDQDGDMSDDQFVKTTIDISDNLLKRAKELAAREQTTLRELTEEGLELILSRRERPAAAHVVPVVVSGRGLSAALKGKSWAEIRDEIYRGYGA
jgi:hypothetical protein